MAAVWHPIGASVCKTGRVTTAPVVSGWWLQGGSFCASREAHPPSLPGTGAEDPGQPPSRVPLQPAASSGGVLQEMGQSQEWGHVWGPRERDRS